ncbi:MAG TPA: ABC transporter substrate-binding protein [Stellaceae bacterium]|nr:ABC transporter substrate-binding protein [Stellaceae bacterium]
MTARNLLAGAAALLALAAPAVAQDTPGVSATEIKIGNTTAYSGAASAYSAIGRGLSAFWRMVNDHGGVAGRRITFISVDDGYSPPKTVEQVRKLVEQDGVAFLFNTLGTASNTAIEKYLNQRKIPQLFVATGADKWGDYKEYPWTIGWSPSYRGEAQIYGKYILKEKPGAKIGLLYQNDDFGKDYAAGLKDVLGDAYDRRVKEVSYEATDTTVESQIVTLQGAGVDLLVTAALPKFAAQAIRKVYDIGWRPLHILSTVSRSIAQVMEPAGTEKGIGVVTAAYVKDMLDPALKDDPGLNELRAFMRQYLPDGDLADNNYVYAYGVGLTMLQVLKQCDGDFSRENVMRQAANLRDLDLPVLLPGIRINTSPTNYHPIRQMQLQRWDGKTWVRFGDVINDTGA